jgi:hypothetical protein
MQPWVRLLWKEHPRNIVPKNGGRVRGGARWLYVILVVMVLDNGMAMI